MFSKGRIIVAGAIAAAACLLTACSGGSGSATSAPPTAGSNRPAAPVATSSGSGLDAALRATTNSSLGAIVVDGAGRTLYRFDKDSASHPASNCQGACETLWPPVLVGAQISLTGVNRALLGTIKRADGTMQLTLHGWPLYRYAGDSAPGDVSGEGIGGVWFAARPTGAKALPASGTSNSPSGNSSGNSSNNGNSSNITSPAGYGY